MSSHRRCAAPALLFGLGVCALLTAGRQGDQETTSDDLTIVAQYYAGHSEWKSWRYTITRDGNVAQEIFDYTKAEKKCKLTEDDLQDLLARIEQANFFALKALYDSPSEDTPTLVLKITRNKKTREVVVHHPHAQENDPEVRRFFRIWAGVLRKVPSPNPHQKPDLYKP